MLKNSILFLYWCPFRRFIQLIRGTFCYRIARLAASLTARFAGNKRACYAREWDVVQAFELPVESREEAVRKAFFCKLCNEFEVFLYPLFNRQNIAQYISLENEQVLAEALEAGRGAILLLTHFGANQMVMPAVGYRGYIMNQLSAPPTVWPEKMPERHFSKVELKTLKKRWEFEQALPARHIDIFGSLRPAYECLKRNEVLGLAMDGGGGATRVEVSLLGRPCYFSTGAVELAMRTKAALIPTFVIRDDSGQNRMIMERPLDLMMDRKDPAAVKSNVQQFATIFQCYIVKYPSHYLDFMSLRRMMCERYGDDPYMD